MGIGTGVGVEVGIDGFVFKTDQSVTDEGVVIDDFVIEGTALAVNEYDLNPVSIYPNPSTNVFNISWVQGAEVSLSVYDITGKSVLKKKKINATDRYYELDMTGYAQGVYFAKINIGDQQITKKLLLK